MKRHYNIYHKGFKRRKDKTPYPKSPYPQLGVTTSTITHTTTALPDSYLTNPFLSDDREEINRNWDRIVLAKPNIGISERTHLDRAYNTLRPDVKRHVSIYELFNRYNSDLYPNITDPYQAAISINSMFNLINYN